MNILKTSQKGEVMNASEDYDILIHHTFMFLTTLKLHTIIILK